MRKVLSEDEKKAVRSLMRAGVHMFVETDFGTRYLENEDEVARILEDENGFEADVQNVNQADIVAFREANGFVQCAATTKRGQQCKNYVEQVYIRDLGVYSSSYPRNLPTPAQKWLALQGRYCAYHEGGHDVGRR